MCSEALKLQVRAETSRRRARERRPNRSKEQVRIRRLHATLAVEYSEALTATADSKVTVATRVGLKALGLDHLPEAILRHVQISPNWAYLLRAEVKKVQAELLKLDKAQLREGKQKRCDAKKYIFDHGMKGVRRGLNKHGTVTGLQQVDHSCPIGLHWEVSPLEHSRPNIKAEMHARSLPWNIPDPISKLRCMSTGPWTKDNLVTAVEFFFQRNAYHPFAQCSYPQKHSDPVPLTEILPNKVGATIADRRMLHYCPHQACAGLDPDSFRSNRKEVK